MELLLVQLLVVPMIYIRVLMLFALGAVRENDSIGGNLFGIGSSPLTFAQELL